jgi:hypothetical protein
MGGDGTTLITMLSEISSWNSSDYAEAAIQTRRYFSDDTSPNNYRPSATSFLLIPGESNVVIRGQK